MGPKTEQSRTTIIAPRRMPTEALIVGLFFLASSVMLRATLHDEVNPIAVAIWVGLGLAASRLALSVWRPPLWPGFREGLRRTGPILTAVGWALGVTILLGPPHDSHALDARLQNRCHGQLQDIAFAVTQYVEANGGHYPDRPEALLPYVYNAAVIVCPSTHDFPATGATPQDIADALAGGGHLSYVYAAKGLTTATTRPDSVVFYEPARNHTRDHPGFHVLYAGERLEYLQGDAAERFRAQIAAKAGAEREAAPRR